MLCLCLNACHDIFFRQPRSSWTSPETYATSCSSRDGWWLSVAPSGFLRFLEASWGLLVRGFLVRGRCLCRGAGVRRSSWLRGGFGGASPCCAPGFWFLVFVFWGSLGCPGFLLVWWLVGSWRPWCPVVPCGAPWCPGRLPWLGARLFLCSPASGGCCSWVTRVGGLWAPFLPCSSCSFAWPPWLRSWPWPWHADRKGGVGGEVKRPLSSLGEAGLGTTHGVWDRLLLGGP